MATGGSGDRKMNTGERIFCSGVSIRKVLIYGGRCGERGDEEMFIRLSKLTGNPIDKDYYINPDQIITYGPNRSDENQTIIYFTDDRKAIAEKSPRDITDILRDCGVEVWR